MEPPVLVAQIDKGQRLVDESQCPEEQQDETMTTSGHRRQLVISLLEYQTDAERVRKADNASGEDLWMEMGQLYDSPGDNETHHIPIDRTIRINTGIHQESQCCQNRKQE